MGFETILNQPLAVKLLQRWLAKKTTQPLLLCGPAGTGKRALALEAAKTLNCKFTSPSPLVGEGRDGGTVQRRNPPPQSRQTAGESPDAWRPPSDLRREEVLEGCGTCVSCKKIVSGNHPDVRVLDMAYQAVVRGEPLEKQQSLRIETVLAERKRLYQTPNEGPWKISILDDAHRMTPDAANVLLKVMEEPPPFTAIFLLTPYRDRLFATLVSRCQPIRFRPLSEGDAQKRLTAVDREAIGEAEALWAQLPKMTANQILSKSEPRSRTTTAVARADVETQLLALLSPALKDLRSGRPQAAAKIEWIQKAHQQLRQNVTPNLVYDHLLLQLAAASKR